MNEEQKLNVQTNNVGGKEYRNISLREIEVGNYVVLEKTWDTNLKKEASKDGRKWNYYIAKAKYNDEEVSFFLGETENVVFENVAKVGEKIKVTKYEETIQKLNKKEIIERLKFDRV